VHQFHHFTGFFHGLCEGFLDENVSAFADRFLAEVKVLGGGGYNVDEVAGVHEGVGVGEAWYLVFLGYFRGIGVFRVIESYQFRLFDLFPIIQMKFPEVTDAKNPYFKHLLFFILRQTYIKMPRVGALPGVVLRLAY
jgi:hypothetical protein